MNWTCCRKKPEDVDIPFYLPNTRERRSDSLDYAMVIGVVRLTLYGTLIDIMPTLVDVGGGTYPKKYKDDEKYPLEGISIRPLFRGDCITRNESLFYEWNDGRAVQTENMKLVQWGDEWELYDRRTDITETRNLAADYPDTVAKLQAQWEAWADLSKH